jgi:hypothetical protein
MNLSTEALNGTASAPSDGPQPIHHFRRYARGSGTGSSNLPPSAGSQVRTRPHDEIEPIEVEGFYQKPRCFAFPSRGVQDATPPGREWFLELIGEHLPSHRGPAMIGDTERLIPNLYARLPKNLGSGRVERA